MKYFNCFIFFLLLFTACKESDEKDKGNIKQLSFRPRIDSLLRDTVHYNPLVDSLRLQVKLVNDTQQISLLNDLSENWRPNSYELADEALFQSTKISFTYGETEAYCKLGINYYRHGNHDSATYFLDKAYDIAVKTNRKKIIAQVLSWKGELLRRKGEKEKAMELINKALAIATEIGDKKRAAFCLNSKGEINRTDNNNKEALACYNQAIAYATEIGDIARIAVCYSSMGDIYRIQNDYPKALEYFNLALDMSRKNRDKFRIALCLTSMGEIYSNQKEYEKSLDYFSQALDISQEIGNQEQVSKCQSTIGQIYYLQNNFSKALEWFDKSIKTAEDNGSSGLIAFSMSNMGEVYKQQKNYPKALECFLSAYKIAEEIDDKNQIASCLSSMGECYLATNNFSEAKKIAEKSLIASKETEIPEQIKNSAWLLYEINENGNNYADALENLKLFMQMKDISGNEDQVKKFAAVEFKAKEDKLKAEQAAKVKVFEAEEAKKEEELKRQKTIRYAFTIGFALLLVLAVVIYRNLQENKKKNKIITAQKKEVEHQKELVDEKNKEITDSITYAKRLQDAILPPLNLVRQYLPESFILYKPKDIIAGDFYWMEIISDQLTENSDQLSVISEKNGKNKILIAAADCTGHGVPGAMVSVVCSNALNRAVKEFGITDPGKILDKVRDLVLETFEKSESEVKDGMDISLVSIESFSPLATFSQGEGRGHEDKVKVQWAGANNPLWYMQDGKFNEIKANKQPIGKTDDPKPFTTHTIELTKGDNFYLFTDGYADQFGGDKGKKFKYKQLQDKLQETDKLMPEQQKENLLTTFDNWKGHLEQIDDVCIIGIRI